jgi:hypothetical protein
VSVTNTLVKVQYNGDGSTVKFAYTMGILIDPNSNPEQVVLPYNLLVYFTQNGATTLQSGSTYTIYSPTDPTNPSSIVFNTAPGAGVLVTIYRLMPLTQESRFRPQQPMDASTMEEAWDYLTYITQQLQEQLDRTVQLDISSTNSTPILLPPPDANMYLRWDPTGTFLINDPGPQVTTTPGESWPFRVVFDTAFPHAKAPTDYGLTGSTWNVGDTCINTGPATGGFEGWKCIAGGAPGTATWAPYGQVSNQTEQ